MKAAATAGRPPGAAPRTVRSLRLAWLALVLSHAILAVYFVDLGLSANPVSRALPVLSLFDEGTLRIDRWASLTVDKAEIDGHFYSDKPPLASALAAAGYGLVRPFLDLPRNPSYRAYRQTRIVMAIGSLLCGALPFLILVLLCFDGARGLARARAAWLVPLAVYGGFLYPYASAFMAHLLGAALLLMAYRSLFEKDRPALAGMLLGLAFLAEYPLAMALPLWAAQDALRRRRVRPALLLGAGFAPAAALGAAYNLYLTGDPLTFAYKFNATEQFAALESAYGLARPSLASVYGLSISPFRGVFFYAPVVLVLGLQVIRAAWRERLGGLATDGALGFFVLSFFFYASRANEPWPVWTGGYCYGPRYLIPATALLIYRGLQTLRDRDRGLILGVTATSAVGLGFAWAAAVTRGFLGGTELEPNPLFAGILPHLLERGPDARHGALVLWSPLQPVAVNLLWLPLFALALALPAWLFRRDVVREPASGLGGRG